MRNKKFLVLDPYPRPFHTQDESPLKQYYGARTIAIQGLLLFQLIAAISLQPYLLYRLKGNLKIFTLVEYITIFGITLAELLKMKYITYRYMEMSQTGEISQMTQGLFFINYRHVIEIIQRHCSYLRKCVLTLIITSFDKMILDPLRFKEYMELKNQMLRYSVFFILNECI